MEEALSIKVRMGVDAAAEWMEIRGISREMAVLALVGAKRAINYGIKVELTDGA